MPKQTSGAHDTNLCLCKVEMTRWSIGSLSNS